MRNVEVATKLSELLVIAGRIVRVPPQVEGVVVECGCYKGGSTCILSLVCEACGRQLHVFDSFEGLPEPAPHDRQHVSVSGEWGESYRRGEWCGTLEEVKSNLERWGAPEVVHLHRGWFEETLPQFDEPVVVAYVDVDLRESLATCVRYLWPRLVPGGFLFTHEARSYQIASLFYDREWWCENLGCEPPGLVAAGSGLGLSPDTRGWNSHLAYAVKRGV